MSGENKRYFDLTAPSDLKRGIFNAIIGPRPIGWISTVNADGVANLAPFSYFNIVSSAPAILAFSTNTPEDRQAKDTLANVRATGEFVYNLASFELIEQVNATAAPLPHGHDEFEHARLEKAQSSLVKPPRVAASPANLECKLLKIVDFGEGEGASPCHVAFGLVVAMHLNEDCLDAEGRFLTQKANPVARLGGIQYAVSAEPFELIRPFKRAREGSE